MINKLTGGPAFPVDEKYDDGAPYLTHPGMTLRDYFAGQALAGFASGSIGNEGDVAWFEQRGAEAAYRVADAMLAERDQ